MKRLTAAERTHFGVLGVNLANVGDSFAQRIDRNLVAVLVLPVGRFVPGTLDLRPSISYFQKKDNKDLKYNK